MTPRDLVYVGHMLETARKAVSKTQGISRETYDADENLRLALIHLIQIIGEAARQVSREFCANHPDIRWADIIGMRHKVVHDYLGVDDDIVTQNAEWRAEGDSLAVERRGKGDGSDRSDWLLGSPHDISIASGFELVGCATGREGPVVKATVPALHHHRPLVHGKLAGYPGAKLIGARLMST